MSLKTYLQNNCSELEEFTYSYEQLKESFNDFDYYDRVLDQLDYTIEGLTTIQSNLTPSLNKQKITPLSAQFIHLAIDGYVKPLGLQSSDLVPSIESFNGEYNQSTLIITIESVESTINKLWNTLKEIVRVIWDKINVLIKQYFTRFGQLENKIKSLKQAVGKEPSNQRLKVRIPRILQLDNTISLQNIENGLTQLIKINQQVKSRYIPETKNFIKNVVDDILSMDEERLKSRTKSQFTAANYLPISDYERIDKKSLLLGDKIFVMDDSSSVPKLVNRYDKKDLEASELMLDIVMTRSILDKVLGNIETITEESLRIKESIGKYEKLYFQNEGAIDSVIERLTNKTLFTIKSKQLRRNLLRPVIQLLQHNFYVCDAVVSFVEYSISQKQNNDK